MRRSKPALALALFFCFLACNAIIGNESSYTLVPDRTCLLPSQCPKGQVCLFKTCSPPCEADVDCVNPNARCLKTEAGTACVVSGTASCSASEPCPRGSVCRDGACRNECSATSCLTDQRCAGGICVSTDPKRDPGAVEAAGGGGAGGAAGADAGGTAGGGASGGGGGHDAGAGGREANSGGSAGDASGGAAAGAAGSAGAGGGPCVPSGAEQCFNGVDDDCNGDVDCADSACDGPAMCAPVPQGATLGTFAMMGTQCPAGYSPLTLNRGLTASVLCEGCSCTPDSTRCETGVYGHGANACPGLYSGVLSNVFSTDCGGVPADANLYYFGIRGFTTCTPSGTPVLPPATWDETSTFCQATKVGGGCAAGSRCVPRLTGELCARTPGETSCAPDYPTSTGETWFTGLDDQRQCGECNCSFGDANCTGAVVRVFASSDCSGANIVDINASQQGEACGLPFIPHSARIIGNATAPSCPPSSYANGEATGKNPQTVCCR